MKKLLDLLAGLILILVVMGLVGGLIAGVVVSVYLIFTDVEFQKMMAVISLSAWVTVLSLRWAIDRATKSRRQE